MNEKQHPIAKVCHQVLNAKLDIVTASRKLRDYRDDFSIKNYDDILLFDKIATQTEYFPLGKQRQNWDKKRLQEMDKKRKELERKYKPAIYEACNRLIKEFSP